MPAPQGLPYQQLRLVSYDLWLPPGDQETKSVSTKARKQTHTTWFPRHSSGPTLPNSQASKSRIFQDVVSPAEPPKSGRIAALVGVDRERLPPVGPG